MTQSSTSTLGDWLKKPISWVVIAVAGVAFVLQQVFAPGLFGSGGDNGGGDGSGTEMLVNKGDAVEVPEGDEVTVSYTVENREREAVKISTVEIKSLKMSGGGPECTGASRAGIVAKVENHLVGKRIEQRSDLDFDVIYTGRDEPVPDCVGATVQADVDILVVPYS
ncbi:hypothetical protein [Aeromicrobium alkaliterrae]|uniref:DUF11 domain-containing protein n=1 Tax=Aeromicrobium alkaliterrae TaxID=302168 RepID=A0ABP4VPU3_9ACTN